MEPEVELRCLEKDMSIVKEIKADAEEEFCKVIFEQCNKKIKCEIKVNQN